MALLGWLMFASAALAEGFSGEQIQQFIDDAIAAGGGEVVLPPGRHRLSQPLVIKNAEKLRLVGLEAEETWLLPVSDAAEGFPLVVIEGPAKAVRLAKLTLTTREAGEAFAGTPLVWVKGAGEVCSEVWVDRCLFEHHAGSGLELDNVVESRVTGCVFMDLREAAVRVTGASTRVVIEHNHLARCGDPAILLGGSTSNCHILANEAVGLRMEAAGEGHQLRDNEPAS